LKVSITKTCINHIILATTIVTTELLFGKLRTQGNDSGVKATFTWTDTLRAINGIQINSISIAELSWDDGQMSGDDVQDSHRQLHNCLMNASNNCNRLRTVPKQPEKQI
jgi:hypothetical protein